MAKNVEELAAQNDGIKQAIASFLKQGINIEFITPSLYE